MFLRGLKVLQVGGGIAGGTATASMCGMGATVVVAHSCGRSGRCVCTGRETSQFQAFLDRGKRREASDDLAGLLASFAPDIVVVDRVAGAPDGLPSDEVGLVERIADLNQAAWVTITAFGLGQDARRHFASDLSLLAAAGVLSQVRAGPDSRPVPLPGHQAMLAAGHAAVLAGLHAVDRRRLTGRPVHVEVSAREAILATGPVLKCCEEMMSIPGAGGLKRFGAPYGAFPTADGFVYIGVVENHQWAGLVRAIGAPGWAYEMNTTELRTLNADRIDALVADWTSSRSKAQCEAFLQAAGTPAAGLKAPDEVLVGPQFVARSCVAVDEDATPPYRYVSRAFPVERSYDRDLAAREPGLHGLKVAEASHVLAGAVAGSVLGAMGASVVKLEDSMRLDVYRRSGPFIDGHRDLDWGGFFAFANHSKGSVLVDEDSTAAAIDWADVVIENWGRSRARRTGVASDVVYASHPDKLGVSCSGFGHTGPEAEYRAYAYVLNAYCGLTHLIRGRSSEVPQVNIAWADFLSAYLIAEIVAAWAVGPNGRAVGGGAIDLAMSEALAERLNESNLQSSGAPADELDRVFRTSGAEQYVAISVNDRGQWQVVRETAASLSHGEGASLAAALAKCNGAEVVGALAREAISAHLMMDIADVVGDPTLYQRGFFASVTHPEWGTRQLIGLPWQFVGEGGIPLGAPPRLDEHFGYVA